MSSRTDSVVEAVIKLAGQKNVEPSIAVLCKAVLHLYKQTGQLHADDLEAFEQIEELDRAARARRRVISRSAARVLPIVRLPRARLILAGAEKASESPLCIP